MAESAKKTDPKLWEKVKKKVTNASKGGKAGQWSARKAQMAVSEYKKEGGGYEGGKSRDNHLAQWTDEEWRTKSGGKSGETGERYLPKKAREKLSETEYARSTRKKRADSRKGKQHSRQPADVAEKTASTRGSGGRDGETKAELMEQAKRRDIAGRSKMSKAELQRALAG